MTKGELMVEVNPRRFTRVARRWWLLAVLLPLLLGGLASEISSRQPSMYLATVKLQVNPAPATDADNYDAILSSKSLAEAYRQSITLRPVLARVIHFLQLPYDVSTLERKVSTNTVIGTSIFTVSVSDHDPNLAAEIANTIAHVFVAHTVGQAASQDDPARKVIDDQIVTAQEQLAVIEAQIGKLEQDPEASEPSIQNQIATLRMSWSQQQETLNQLLSSASQMDLSAASAQNHITIVEDALPPTSPYAPRTQLITLLAILGGLGLALASIFLIGYLDNTVNAEIDFEGMVRSPLLATVGTIPKLREGRDQLFLVSHPLTTSTESIRLLRTKLGFVMAERKMKILAICSPELGDGKSTITANLGVALGQAGHSVTILDADLRCPSQHRIFEACNERGLTTILTQPRQMWQLAALDVAPNVKLIPSGPLLPNPADLLSHHRFGELVCKIGKESEFVLIDTSALLAASDSLIVTTSVDGSILLVCRADCTKLDSLRRSADMLHQSTGRVVGVVLN
jgi:capsular exopolysaccharide synthesis family protein